MRNLIVYLRFLSKHKTLSIINVFGLSIGIATCIFIGLYVTHELSYDRYHKNIDRIFAVTAKFTSPNSLDHISTVSSPLSTALKHNYPEVQEVVRLKPLHNATVGYQSNFFLEKDIYEADPQLFNVFTYHLLKGDPGTALTGSQNMLITQSLGVKYFGQDDPLNKTLTVNNKEYQVTGVLEDLPSNSDLRFSALLSIDRTRAEDWWGFDHYTYILFNENYLKTDANAALFGEKLIKFSDLKFNEALKKENESLRVSLILEPLAAMHFRQELFDETPKGNIKYIYILASVALLMLFIGSLNFINFSLVQSLERGKEVGIRKVIGARYFQLVRRYLTESLLITLLAFVIAVLLVTVLMPLFNDITGKSFQLRDLLRIQYIGSALLIVLLVGTLAGTYPAFFTSSIKPLQSLKGKMTSVKGAAFRKISIVAQFSIAIGLIICTLLTSSQMEFISNYDLGFRKNNIVVINVPVDSAYAKTLKLFKTSLSKNATIQVVSNLSYGALPGDVPTKATVRTTVDGETKVVIFSRVDEDYLTVLDIALSQGRNFEVSRISDKGSAVIINESFAKVWGWENPLDEKIRWGEKDVNVIGVMKDFHFSSLHNPIEPAIVFYNDAVVVKVLVRFKSNYPVSKQISLLKNAWATLFPDQPFVYNFLDESIAAQYINEEKAITLFTIFSSLTIIVSCLGLFGLCSLTISQRKKEVGIRKIVGATFTSIVSLFSKEYLILIGCSFVIITPISILLMNRWLESFPWRESISVSVFIVTGIGVIVLGLLTIILSIAKTSNTNPSDLIREQRG